MDTQIQTTEEQKKDNVASESEVVLDGQNVDQDVIVDMTKAGVLYGHKMSRRNPKFQDYSFTTRNGSEIIDLTKTLKAIDMTAEFLKKSLQEKKTFIVVGTQPAAREAVGRLSKALLNCPNVTNKWIGGLLSNFQIISKRIEYFKKRKKDFDEKRFDKYTKKERLMIEREIEKMNKKFSGLEELQSVPSIMFVVDSSLKGHITAIREAKLTNMKLVGIIDNDDNPELFDFFVPANDHAKSSIEWVVDAIIAKLS